MVNRGEIWWANLPEPTGSSPGYRRPILIVQSNHFNHSKINTTVVLVISTNLKLAESFGNIFLKTRQSGLSKDSVVNVTQLYTIDESFLSEYVETLSEQKMEQIDKGLRLVLSL
jgi:mRNA interferase MazF